MPPRITFSTAPLSTLAATILGGLAALADTVIYTDEASFLAAVPAGDVFLADFDALSPGYQGTTRIFGPEHGFQFQVSATGNGLWSIDGDLSTNTSYATLTITTAGEPSAVGGNIWLSGIDQLPALGDMTITLDDGAGTSITLTDAEPNAFLGFVTDGAPIQAVHVTPVDPNDGDFRWATIDNTQLTASVAPGFCSLPSLSAVVKTPTSNPSPWDVATTDWDGDGDLDVLMACSQGSAYDSGVKLALNDGAGGFTIANTWLASGVYGMTGIDCFDADGDGDVDVFTTDHAIYDDLCSVLMWERVGNELAAPVALADAPDGDFQKGEFRRLTHGDYDNDGDVDLAAVGSSYPDTMGGVWLLTNAGDATFSLSHLQITGAAELVKDIETGDMNGDGALDLVAVTYGTTVGVLLGNGDGTFAPAVTFPSPDESLGVGIADVDNDGDLDFAVVSKEDVEETFRIYINVDGSGTSYSVEGHRPIDNGLTDVTFTDLDGDGDNDAVISDRNLNSVIYYLNDGFGSFSNPAFIDVLTVDVYSVIAADFSGDGIDDLVLPDTSGALAYYENQCVPPPPGDTDGDGDVDSTDLAVLLANFGMTTGATVPDGDTDGDGDVDSTDLATLLANFGLLR